MTRKRVAALASIGVFAAGLVGLYFLIGSLKDGFSETTIYAVAVVGFGVICGLGILIERLIYQPPDEPPFDPNPN
jgi:hypothetical protein